MSAVAKTFFELSAEETKRVMGPAGPALSATYMAQYLGSILIDTSNLVDLRTGRAPEQVHQKF